MNPISLNSYRTLPAQMFKADAPVATHDPRLLLLNADLLKEYGIADTWFTGSEGLGILSGHTINSDNPPIAMAYAGHQFGHRAPLLGDGRAHLLGQMNTTRGTVDVQLKGSGQTSFSRGGDGRATLASVLREHIVSEAMAGLGIPTTRSLAVIATGDTVYRDEAEPGGILVRTARSHVRVGSFQYAAENLGPDGIKSLADHVIDQHLPSTAGDADRYVHLLKEVSERQAKLIAQWMLVGFIHGVMNTDNMSIVGETIDFGPCAFMDEFHVDKVFSSIDRRGRYAWSRQPGIGLWNLTRFAETLLPLLSHDDATAIKIAEASLEGFMPAFQAAFYDGLRKKLGLTQSTEVNNEFGDQTITLLHEQSVDMTIFFDTLTGIAEGGPEQAMHELLANSAQIKQWLNQWNELRTDDRETTQTMRLANPAMIARNHRVEEALRAATAHSDLAPLQRLVAALKTPFYCSPENTDLQLPPLPEERVTATFCGT
ncbi:MAG: protein adenylyltransferase SelO [Gammaproteobacteria bacterium]